MDHKAILRFDKLKSTKEIGCRASHHLREHAVPNADPTRSSANAVGGLKCVRTLLAAFKDREHLVRRKDAVRCVEAVLTASPGWWKDGGDVREFKRRAIVFMNRVFGPGNVLSYGMHWDETTPHVWVLVSPVTQDGRLCASDFIGSPDKLRRLQDAWAAMTREIGLQRGVRGSTARHQSIRTYYAAVNGCEEAQARLAREAQRRANSAWSRAQAESARQHMLTAIKRAKPT